MTSEADAPEPDALVELRAQAATVRAMLDRLSPRQDAVAAHTPHDLTRLLADRDRRQDDLQREADARMRIINEQAQHIRSLEEQLRTLQEAADERLALLEANHHSHAAFRATVRDRLRELIDAIPDESP
jgi:septal ring factor EnvC (AmiA/AmiB activator)